VKTIVTIAIDILGEDLRNIATICVRRSCTPSHPSIAFSGSALVDATLSALRRVVSNEDRARVPDTLLRQEDDGAEEDRELAWAAESGE
jgi:hypothetical protein